MGNTQQQEAAPTIQPQENDAIAEEDKVANYGMHFSFLKENACNTCFKEAEHALEKYNKEKSTPTDYDYLRYLERFLREKQLLLDTCILKHFAAQYQIPDCFPAMEALNSLAESQTVIKSSDQLAALVQVNKCWKQNQEEHEVKIRHFSNLFEIIARARAKELFPKYAKMIENASGTTSCDAETEAAKACKPGADCYIKNKRRDMCNKCNKCVKQIQACVQVQSTSLDTIRGVSFAQCINEDAQVQACFKM